MSEATQALIARHIAEYDALAKQERHITIDMVHFCGDSLFQAFQIALDDDALPPATRLLYDAAEKISSSADDITYDHPEASRQRLAYVLALDALLTSPDAVMAAIKQVRDDLVAGDPKLALMK